MTGSTRLRRLRISLCLPSSLTWENREVVSRCLPLGVFKGVTVSSVDDLHRLSVRLWIRGSRLSQRGLGRPPHALFSTG